MSTDTPTNEGPRFPDIVVPLVGQDGGAFAIVGRVARALRADGVPADTVDEFRHEALSGTYDDLLRTVIRWVDVE